MDIEFYVSHLSTRDANTGTLSGDSDSASSFRGTEKMNVP